MEAIREAKRKGAQVFAISNVLEASIPRLADYAFYTHAGPEIGVASTKAFTTQLVAIALLAIHLGRRTGTLTKERAHELIAELVALPNKMRDIVESGAQIQAIARRYGNATGFLFLGRARSTDRPRGRAQAQGDLVHPRRGLRAGEMKHGPIALIDEHLQWSSSCRAARSTTRPCRTSPRSGRAKAGDRDRVARRQRDRRPLRRRDRRPRYAFELQRS